MTTRKSATIIALVAMAATGWWTQSGRAAEPTAPGVTYDTAFWRHWSDGAAELAAYDLTFQRYGAARRGTAVTIFVKEDFANSARVKANPGRPASDRFPVMKLNLVQDFPTGIYDYNMMTSTFVALEPANGRPAGSPAKVSFSSQEWCGQVYGQLLFDQSHIRRTVHSYFDGEADQEDTLEYPTDGISEDTLVFWARGMAGPALRPGESVKRPLLRSLEHARLAHQPLEWHSATLSRDTSPRTVTVPAGEFRTDVYRAIITKGDSAVFYVERTAPHRIVRWETMDGHRADLVGSKRLKYWEMNGARFADAVRELGLTPRPARTP